MTEKGTTVRFLIFSWMVMAMVAFGAYPWPVYANQLGGYVWTIEKTACTNEVTMVLGQQLQIDFTLTVDANLQPGADPNIDECVEVLDTQLSAPLGAVCVEETPKTLTYSVLIGPYNECGDYQVCNTARFVTSDTWTVGSSDWNIVVHVSCDCGCTLTPGYWKTHSKYGPAPYDDTWALVEPDGEDSAFFDTGQSWYEVLWTEPKGGNAYYILAHAYIAAALNEANGACVPPEVATALDNAEFLLDRFDGKPERMREGLKCRRARRARRGFIKNAEVLDDYNNGIIGPGHCTE
jgi:hypothetical protein